MFPPVTIHIVAANLVLEALSQPKCHQMMSKTGRSSDSHGKSDTGNASLTDYLIEIPGVA